MLLVSTTFLAQAQTRVTGIILDAETKKRLPAVTVRVGPALGTSSGPDGTFSLAVPGTQRPATLRLSCLGYATLAVALRDLPTTQGQLFYLRRQQALLSPVVVMAQRWVERKVGITTTRTLVHFTDGTLPPGKPFEIAQLMRVGTAGAALTSVNLFLAADQPDSITVAVRLYRLEADRPTILLMDQPISQRVALRQGWLRLDLTRYNLYLTEDFVVGLTFLPDSTQRYAVPIDIKLGGSAKSFARPAGTSDWRVPPHHYRLYITARMPEHVVPATATEAENQETPASARLYSVAVQDSFSLFVQLPKGYTHSSRRRYPVVILLDGNIYFDQVGDAARKLPRREASILVGVGRHTFLQQDSLRQRDYTYPAAALTDSMPQSGGGRQFLAFLEQELLPYLDRTYQTDPAQRTLMGHSLGGYFTLFALSESLKTNRSSFSRYVAASPSLYYADHYLLQQLTTLTPATPPFPVQVRVTIGAQEMGETAEGRANQAAFQEALALLSAGKLSSVLSVERTVYPGYGHMETAIPTFTTSLHQWRASAAGSKMERP